MNDGEFNLARVAEESSRQEIAIESMMASRGIVGVNATAFNLDIILDYKGQRTYKIPYEQAVAYVTNSLNSDALWESITQAGLIRNEPKTD